MTALSPTYDLVEIQVKVRAGPYRITHSARSGAAAVGLSEHDVVACVLLLTVADFYKTMESDAVPDCGKTSIARRLGRRRST